MANYNNYIKDTNPFDLKGPPDWWLQKLHDFDDSLVLLPSKMGYQYRLAQRRPPDPRAQLVHHVSADSDSKMLASYGLVPVTTVIATVRWDNPLMWEDLRQRMPSRMGGADAFEAQLDKQEAQLEAEIRADRDDMLNQVGKDSFKYYQLKKGVRSHLWSPKTKDRSYKPSNAPLIKVVTPYSKVRDKE